MKWNNTKMPYVSTSLNHVPIWKGHESTHTKTSLKILGKIVLWANLYKHESTHTEPNLKIYEN